MYSPRIARRMALTLLALVLGFQAPASNAAPSFEKRWSFKHTTPGQLSEIPAFDPKTRTLWIAGVVGVDVLDLETGSLIEHIDLKSEGAINSVAIHNGIAAMALEATGDRRQPGRVLLYSTKTRQPLKGINQIAVGALPDSLTFTPNGRYLLVANEGTPNAVADTPYTTPDPVGSVSIIDFKKRRVVGSPSPIDAPVTGSFLRTNIGMDFEPEYLAVSKDSRFAYVTLQEANGLGILNLRSQQFDQVVGLGVKDFSRLDSGFGGSNYIDPNDKDNKIELRSVAVRGLYQPDAIAWFETGKKSYLIMANEGDTREDEADKVRASTIAGTPKDLERLNVSKVDSTPGSLVTFGARSFSIRDTEGRLVYDSGNELEKAAIAAKIYDDNRSDDKGVEPEGVSILKVKDKTYAFIGLERTTKSAIAFYDVTNPEAPVFLDLIVSDNDLSPEGLATFVIGKTYYLLISNEVSNTTTLYQLGSL